MNFYIDTGRPDSVKNISEALKSCIFRAERQAAACSVSETTDLSARGRQTHCPLPRMRRAASQSARPRACRFYNTVRP